MGQLMATLKAPIEIIYWVLKVYVKEGATVRCQWGWALREGPAGAARGTEGSARSEGSGKAA